MPSSHEEAAALKNGPLRGIADIRSFFRTNETPIYFVSATAFNLLGIDRWVRNFKFLNYYDSFDGFHPNVFVPEERARASSHRSRRSRNYLLGHKEVADFVGRRGPGGKAAFLMFDEETEQLAGELGLEVAFPPAVAPSPAGLEDRHHAARQRRRRAERAEHDGSRGRLRGARAARARRGLGDDLVVQTPYGDSGQTTFFIADEGTGRRTRRRSSGTTSR